MKVGKTQVNGIIIAALIISASIVGVAYYVIKNGGFNIQFGDVDLSGFGTNETPLTLDPTQTNPTPTAPVDSSTGEAPTSLTIDVEPIPLEMGERLWGEVVSDGKDYPATIHALHVGTDVEQEIGVRLSDTGRAYYDRVINIPGYWDFWVTADSIKSNTMRATVEGVLIIPEQLHYSHTFTDYIDCELFSHTSGNAQIIAIDAEHMIMIPMTNTVINTNGYGTVSLDFSSFSTGNYEITVLINGLDSADFGANPFVEVGR